jgi:hypothetical protein
MVSVIGAPGTGLDSEASGFAVVPSLWVRQRREDVTVKPKLEAGAGAGDVVGSFAL